MIPDWPTGQYGAILCDPPWAFQTYSGPAVPTEGEQPYQTMTRSEIAGLPVASLAAPDCVLFLWVTWPTIEHGLQSIAVWGFKYKTCAFAWTKAHAGQIELFQDDITARMGMGYWTRGNTEVCLLATKGRPRRLHGDVRQGIISPRREHSRKPECIYQRIERLVAGPYVELFARQRRPGWNCWGDQTEKFPRAAE